MAAAQCSLELGLHGVATSLGGILAEPMPLSTIADPGGRQQAMLSRVPRYDSSHGSSTIVFAQLLSRFMLPHAQSLHPYMCVLMCVVG